MNPLPPATRNANRWLLAALVIFAIALAVTCFLWMRVVVRNNGGIVDPQPRATSFVPAYNGSWDRFCFANCHALPYLIS